ncbi:2-C-methyl-D-erythritol 4-phosphate cytidylyltransferase [Vibrio splendidus]|jgi:2-C-methyl-D-erythritol 4-phosphate cytidylyltransferase|uniref:2-C-methyl-D-erythritol 4-phosphate cytidylyltransferase n=1 Tax=Vibrio splendidus TaxID=29497 RepID=UPI0000671455|nr:2-C-methyl-D-erythritol 4-phosphate cytidylyltransferase [Vibrio splendidus]EAP93645.1 2-C-methyl-D-erythritol 4-phosphate cytidylyltransferase [Vibrio splendidus 12B01]OED75158.1 2-C-methyl-D-erythritol 4-phosphate cytidylyltransferase [Vibrio splendidus ZF-90]OEF16916.1 2-C-methyl-D-erythritol 4-phosphate cytidylyltransferase [Vibrio splendidus 5S-101]PMO69958.1 2-C-methyl-D-erythritol 4-phosphate cytidylyltransferase [Vibrio splendidus]PTO78687.1 2-C-methyl-D-erythritol 4-phosphate cytid
MSNQLQSVIAVVPAAGVGSRMKADRPKQYLQIHGKTILEHTVEKLLSHPQVSKIVVAVSDDDPYYPELPLNLNPQVIRVSGGTERADSVLSALDYIAQQQLSDWVMVHDAARPCIQLSDIDKLISGAMTHDVGAILAAPVRDTMKRGAQGQIEHTVDRVDLWHALTPQMFRSKPLRKVLSEALQQGVSITDEASAFEWKGLSPALIGGRSDNFKITQPEDLALAEFYLSQNKE